MILNHERREMSGPNDNFQSMTDSELITEHQEAVRLFIWYSGSFASFHKGKSNRQLAERYGIRAHEIRAEQRSRRERNS